MDAKNRKTATMMLILSTIGLGVICIGGLATMFFGSKSPSSVEPTALVSPTIPPTETPNIYGEESKAVIRCQRFIRDKLLSPDSANFHWEVQAWRIEGKPGYWSILGQVDGVNAFNVKLTNTYACDLHYNPDNDAYIVDSWNLE